MSEIESEQQEPGLADLTDGSGGLPEEGSLLDALAEQRDLLATTRETFIPIFGYEKSGMTLYAKYRLLDGDELSKIGKRVSGQFSRNKVYERNLYSSMDVMIEACEGLFVDRGDGEKIQLKQDGRSITGYSTDLASALKITINPDSPARSVVLGVFGGNIAGLQQHSIMLARWMGNTTLNVAEEFLEATGNL